MEGVKKINRILLPSQFLLMLLVVVLLPYHVVAQNEQQPLFLSVDRNLFVVGETIELKLFSNKSFLDTTDNIAYVYCDLLGQDGEVYSGEKIKLTSDLAQFRMLIPAYLQSGNYLLRAYASNMRNNPSSYAIRWLRIVNPNDASLLSVKSGGQLELSLDTVLESTKIRVQGLDSIYEKRSFIECSFILDSSLLNPSLSLSVVKKAAYSPYHLRSRVLNLNNKMSNYIHEDQRLFISGHLAPEKPDKHVKLSNIRMYFSIQASNDVFSTITDSLGFFASSLPDIYGKHEVYITTEKLDDKIRIYVDKDFDNQSYYSWKQPFYLSPNELKCVLSMAQNYALMKSYREEKHSADSTYSIRPFYGKADEVIQIDEYIDLPNLSMYFTELPGNVHLHKKNEGFEARIINPQFVQLFQPPLIMVDYVVVNDLNAVLKMNPKKVDRIEIIRSDYYKGTASFGGIINFITKDGDFGGYDFSSSSISMTYDFLSPLRKSSDSYEGINDSIPDTRNTLLWQPCIKIDENNKFSIKFFTSQTPGTYSIIVHGLDKDGNLIRYSTDFEVR